MRQRRRVRRVKRAVGVLRSCGTCTRIFTICEPCNRGHRYCSATCSQLSREKQQKKYSRMYQTSEQGRIKSRERQKRYRAKKRQNADSGDGVTQQSCGRQNHGAHDLHGALFPETNVIPLLASKMSVRLTTADPHKSSKNRRHAKSCFKACMACRRRISRFQARDREEWRREMREMVREIRIENESR